MKNIFILAGPTAVGKTEISINLAKELNGEIISADSMQIYKKMDIGSAKISNKEMNGVPHYLIDFLDPSKEFSVAEFSNLAKDKIDEITLASKLPMIVGGTGLYINSVICNYNFANTNKDEEYRNKLMEIAEEKGKEFVFDMLKKVDPISSEKICMNNLKRVIRALEVYEVTGKPFSSFSQEEDMYNVPYNIYYYVLNMNRDKLYERINKRVDIMLEKGLVEEVIRLQKEGYNCDMQSMKGIGYKEILYYLNGDISLEKAVEMIKQFSRNYAKRQLTWFRKDPRVIWIDKDQFKSDLEVADYIIRDYRNRRIKYSQ